MGRDKVIILGAGLAGLAAGRVLMSTGQDYLILETAGRVGGLCRTEHAGDYTFDYTGHLLHLKEGESKDLILNLIGDRLTEHSRRASVDIEGNLIPYPVQAHFNDLPAPLARQCREELDEAANAVIPGGLPFDQWARQRFGPTLAGLFMIPYNTKLYIHPIQEMEISWTSWSVPVMTARELENIRQGRDHPEYGYNATFFYPAQGGIEILPQALAGGQEGRIRTGARISGIDAARRVITLAAGETLDYGKLISTVPLPDLLGMATGLPDDLEGAENKLRYSSVLGVCIGLDGLIDTDDHWIYFPDETLPFYRLGFPTNFSKQVAPEGCGSLYAEAAWAGHYAPDPDLVTDAAMKTLVKKGFIEPSTGIAERLDLTIPCAYVFHDLYRARNLDSILKSLEVSDILSIGRYGAWEYSSMQNAVQWGLDTARGLLQ